MIRLDIGRVRPTAHVTCAWAPDPLLINPSWTLVPVRPLNLFKHEGAKQQPQSYAPHVGPTPIAPPNNWTQIGMVGWAPHFPVPMIPFPTLTAPLTLLL